MISLHKFLLGVSLAALCTAACNDLDNPPITREPRWDSARTRELAAHACFQCHSNETDWHWFHHLPGVEQQVSDEVHEARSKLNFSEWDKKQKSYDDAPEEIREKEMPPADFLRAYPYKDLSDSEREELAKGLEATFAADPPPSTL